MRELLDRTWPDDAFWLEPAILPKGGKMLFGGTAKTGKSFIMLELARALIAGSGEHPFGYTGFKTHGRPRVLIYEQEIGERGLQSRASAVFKGMDVERLHYVSHDPVYKLDRASGVQRFIADIESFAPNILMLDPISKFHSCDENDATMIGKVLEQLDILIERFRPELNLSVILSHHFGKPKMDQYGRVIDPLNPYNFRGSSKWYDDADCLVTFYRPPGLVVGKHGWPLVSRWESRHGEMPDVLRLHINEFDDFRVRAVAKPVVVTKPPQEVEKDVLSALRALRS